MKQASHGSSRTKKSPSSAEREETNNNFAELEAWMDQLLDQSPELQVSWINQHVDDLAMREQLLALQAKLQTPDWIDGGVVELLGTNRHQAASREFDQLAPQSKLGKYQLLHMLGEGGASIVWLAERCDGSQQKVAVKCLRAGLVSAVTRERFVTEQRMLAKLAHPNIVQLLDAGVSDQGVPYIVMEYIDGAGLIAHSQALTLSQRLNLFCDLTAAVAFAHQNLVLHRDIKPNNVMVTKQGAVKLLDFGIGRFLHETGDATVTLSRALTPAYAAPEQFSAQRLSTSVDVFGLGAVLYEMLVFSPPFAGVDRLLQRDATVTRPSERIVRTTISNAHVTAAQLRGDLDTIVLHALAPTPDRRYPTAQALLEDVQRFLQLRPITARPTSWWYRSSRFVRRHWLSAAVVSVASVALALGVAMVVKANMRAQRQQLRAEQSLAFVESLFRNEANDPTGANLPSTKELLERGIRRADTTLANDPLGHAQVLRWIGNALAQSDRQQEAVPILQRALFIGEREQDFPRAQALDLRIALLHAKLQSSERNAEILWQEFNAISSNTNDVIAEARIAALRAALHELDDHYDAADADLQKALQLTESSAQQAITDGLSASTEQQALLNWRAEWWSQKSAIATNQSRHAQAASYAQAALGAIRSNPQHTHRAEVDALIELGAALAWNGNVRAEPVLREALAAARALSSQANLPSAKAASALANLLSVNGQLDEATEQFQFAYKTRLTLLGAEHQLVQDTQGDLATLARRKGDLPQAKELYAAMLEKPDLEKMGPAREAILRGNYADVLVELEEFDLALPLVERAIELRRSSMGPGATGPAHYYLWRIAMGREQFELALQTASSGLAELRSGDQETIDIGLLQLCLAESKRRLGDRVGARRAFDEQLELQKRVLEPNHSRWGTVHLLDALLLHDAGDLAGARVALAKAEARLKRSPGLAKVWRQQWLALQRKL
jgi:eukaryotic-like serine/threonine-protein kinase